MLIKLRVPFEYFLLDTISGLARTDYVLYSKGRINVNDVKHGSIYFQNKNAHTSNFVIKLGGKISLILVFGCDFL